MKIPTRVEGRKIINQRGEWELLEAPSQSTRHPINGWQYTARSIYTGPTAPHGKEVVCHFDADLALAWFVANTVPGDSV